jgi:ubiquitin C-terminal hydrolase
MQLQQSLADVLTDGVQWSLGWRFSEHMQHQDAGTFFEQVCIDRMHTLLQGTAQSGIVRALYHGRTRGTRTCAQCGLRSTTVDSYRKLEVAVAGLGSLDESLRHSFPRGPVAAPPDYRCEGCGARGTCMEHKSIDAAPYVLTCSLTTSIHILVVDSKSW